MTLAAVRRILDERVGLDPDTLGPTAFPQAVADRCRVLGLPDSSAYAVRVGRDSAEFDALLAKLVVSETWFFRGGVFEALAKRATEVRAGHPDRPFRALSVPCSTGEEPYSLAMALLDAGLIAAGSWVIDAVDVSPAAVAVAKRGVYRDLSFRQTPPAVRTRFFRTGADGWELDPMIRGRVRFRVGNLLAPAAFAADAASYDLVLCRNLLIYLTPDGRRRVVDLLETLLAPGGWLAVGHAEPSILDGRRFGPVGPDGGFVFAKGVPPRSERIAVPEKRNRSPQPPPRSGEGEPKLFSASPLRFGEGPGEGLSFGPQIPVSQPLSPKGRGEEERKLLRCRELADAGRLADARVECEQALASAPSADGYALLGVIQQAAGNLDAAAEAFRKALYLNPTHREALTHAELVSRTRGQTAAADAYRARLARVPGGES